MNSAVFVDPRPLYILRVGYVSHSAHVYPASPPHQQGRRGWSHPFAWATLENMSFLLCQELTNNSWSSCLGSLSISIWPASSNRACFRVYRSPHGNSATRRFSGVLTPTLELAVYHLSDGINHSFTLIHTLTNNFIFIQSNFYSLM